ncbi:hypothetical protein DW322_08885 [Rhodococcus rhodnii]|nr:N-acetylmuramoyl-L-alanine amidase [Rhodococcus rhodnii]TXG90319.1 hypothetical protein DW322_08885 [Rhodococcus rhodnii]
MADPIWLTPVLRDAGLTVNELHGAYNRGHGDFGTIWGVLAHHTGSNPPSNNPNYIANHPSLGLASQLHLSRSGVFTLCGVGIAWHAGAGSWPGIPTNNGNQVLIGIEAENNGREGWSDAQYGAYVKGVAAILKRLGRGQDRVIGHKEYGAIQGKWDPGGMDMNLFRIRVGEAMRGRPAVIINMIDEAAGRNPWVGDRRSEREIVVGGDGKGRMVPFANAHIYFHPSVGAFPVPHADPALGPEKSGLFEAWASYNYERGPLGYPVREFTRLEKRDGRSTAGAVQAFQGGVLYRRDGDARGWFVTGVIGERWAAEGYEKGPLGYPVSNEYKRPDGGVVQDFEHGSMYWDPSGAVKILTEGE